MVFEEGDIYSHSELRILLQGEGTRDLREQCVRELKGYERHANRAHPEGDVHSSHVLRAFWGMRCSIGAWRPLPSARGKEKEGI